MSEKIVLVTRSSNPIVVKTAKVLPMIAYSQRSPLLYKYLQQAYGKRVLEKVDLVMTINSYQGIKKLLAAGDYFSVLPRHSVEQELKSKLFKVVHAFELVGDVFLAYPAGYEIEKLNHVFRQQIIAHFKQLDF